MSVYRLKVSVKDDPDVFRIIDVDAEYPLIVLHKAILNSISFEDGELASFYENYESRSDREEYCLTEMQQEDGATMMKDVRIMDVMKTEDCKLTYVYDFLNMWMFEVEMQEILPRKEGEKLPKLIESSGDNPVQEVFTGFDTDDLSSNDIEMLKTLFDKNDELFEDAAKSTSFDLSDFDDIDDIDSDPGFESLDDIDDNIVDDSY
jgi:hypothetical protein